MGIDKASISAPVSVSHGGALEALAATQPAKESKKGWLGLSGVGNLLFGDDDKDNNLNSTLSATTKSRPTKRVAVDTSEISLPLERDGTYRPATLSKPTRAAKLTERKESKWFWEDRKKITKRDISGPASAPVLVSGGSTLAQLMVDNAGPTAEGLRALGIEPDQNLLALDEAWERTRMRAATPGIPDPDYVPDKEPPPPAASASDASAKPAAPIVAPIFPVPGSVPATLERQPEAAKPSAPESAQPPPPQPHEPPPATDSGKPYGETQMADVFQSEDPDALPEKNKPEAVPEPGGLAASSQLRSAEDFPNAGAGAAPFIAGSHGPTRKMPKMSVLKQLEADYRYDIQANRVQRLQADARREQERLADEKARLEAGRAMTIWAAAYHGQLARVQYLIESRQAGPNEWDPQNDNVTPLHLASAQNRVDVARYLLGKGADPNYKAGKLEATPFHWACKYGHVEIVHLLYKSGADPTIRDGGGFNCLQLAMSSGQPGCMAYMVAVMGDLFQSAHFGIIERMVYLIENKFYDVDDTDNMTGRGVTALHLSSVGGHTKCVEYLLSKGATVDVMAGETASTPLMWSTRARNLNMVKLLVQHGADVHYRDKNGYNVLNFAQQMRPPFPEMVQFFVKECGMDASDALPPALASTNNLGPAAQGDEEEPDYERMDEIEMRAEQELQHQLSGLSKADIHAFYASTMRANTAPGPGYLERADTHGSSLSAVSSRGDPDFDVYDTTEHIEPICLASIRTTHAPLNTDELPLRQVGGIVRVLRNFEDFWSLGEIDEVSTGPDGNTKIRRRRGFFPTSYVETMTWGEVVARAI